MTTPPFISNDDILAAQSRSPRAIGQVKLNALGFHIDMTDAEIDEVARQAKKVRDDYQKWEEFYRDLKLRKLRLQGFKAVLLALDVTEAAAAMQTTPELVRAVMTQYAQTEQARVDELQILWDSGQLPAVPVLSDPSEQVIDPQLTDEVRTV